MFRKLAAECFGTFWLVFGGCGSAVLAASFPELGIGFAGVALAFGLTVLTMPLLLVIFLGVILTRRSLLVYGLADVSRQKKSLAM